MYLKFKLFKIEEMLIDIGVNPLMPGGNKKLPPDIKGLKIYLNQY